MFKNPRALRLHVERLHSSKRGKQRKRTRQKSRQKTSSLLEQGRRKEQERKSDSTRVREANRRKEEKEKERKERSVTKISSHCIPFYPHPHAHTPFLHTYHQPPFCLNITTRASLSQGAFFCVCPMCSTPDSSGTTSLGCVHTLCLC